MTRHMKSAAEMPRCWCGGTWSADGRGCQVDILERKIEALEQRLERMEQSLVSVSEVAS